MLIVKLLTGPLQIIFFCVTNAMILHGLFLNQKYLKTIKINTITRLQNAKKLQVKMCKIFSCLYFSGTFRRSGLCYTGNEILFHTTTYLRGHDDQYDEIECTIYDPEQIASLCGYYQDRRPNFHS
jgi:hypothetical protein